MIRSTQIQFISLFLILSIFLFFITSCHKENEAIKEPEFNLIYPNGGELFQKGSSYEIKWSSEFEDNIKIELFYNEDKVETILSSSENSGKYNWEVPEYLLEGIYFRIKITNLTSENISDISDSRFIITQPIETSTFTDPKDAKVYKTVKIGDQWWMAENYNYDAEIGAASYFNDTIFCEQYGRLYTQESAYLNNPPGWHLPSDEEWQELEAYLGIPSASLDMEGLRGSFTADLMKIGGGSGFDVIWAGYCNARVNKFGHMGYEARFWSSTIVNSENRYWIRLFDINKGNINRMHMKNDFGASVRYVKD